MNGLHINGKEFAPSRFSMEYRLETRKQNIAIEQVVLMKPFIEFDEMFEVPTQSERWYVNDPDKIKSHREHWEKIDDQNVSAYLQSNDRDELELLERQKCARVIQAMGEQLILNQLHINISIILMHRFYVFHPITMFPFEVTAGAALSLGAMSEDKQIPKKMILMALLEALERPTPSQSTLDEFLDEINLTEQSMTTTLGYDFLVKHPNRYIREACTLFNIDEKQKLAIKGIANYSLLLTTFCIRYPPKLIAAFSIYYVALRDKFELDDREGKAWFYHIHKNIKIEMLEIMKDEFTRNEEKIPDMLKFQNTQRYQAPETKRQQIVYEQDKSSNKSISVDTNEDETSECSRKRQKFTSERSQKDLNVHPKKFDNSKQPSLSPLQNIMNTKKTISRLLPQQHLYQLPSPNQSTAQKLIIDQQVSRIGNGSNANEFKCNFSGDSSESTKPGSFKSATFKKVVKKPRQILTRYDPNPGEFISSSKGIKSTVPLKIVPPKQVSKDDLVKTQSSSIIYVAETYTETKVSKQRVSHFGKSTSSNEIAPTTASNAEHDINDLVMEKIVDRSQGSSAFEWHSMDLMPPESRMEVTDRSNDEANDCTLSENTHSKKSKKHHRSKRTKHMIKHSGTKIPRRSENLGGGSSSNNQPLRIVIKKTSTGNSSSFEIKSSTVTEKFVSNVIDVETKE